MTDARERRYDLQRTSFAGERRPLPQGRDPFEIFEPRWPAWATVAFAALAGAAAWSVVVLFLVLLFAVFR